jgi:hypothetical protein
MIDDVDELACFSPMVSLISRHASTSPPSPFSLWVPEQYGERVALWCNELAAKMEKHDSFPDILKGQFKEASDDPLGLELPMKLFNQMLRDEPDDELVWIIGHLQVHTDSVVRIGACVAEQNRRALEL